MYIFPKTIPRNRLFSSLTLLSLIAALSGCGSGTSTATAPRPTEATVANSSVNSSVNSPSTSDPGSLDPAGSSVSLASSGSDFYCMSSVHSTDQIPVLKELGVRWVRVWIDVDWNSRVPPWQFNLVRNLKSAGFKTIVLFHNPNVPAYSQVKNYFDWALSQGMAPYIDVWEIINELNIVPKYWTGTPGQYVLNILKPAWYSLNPAGEKVLGGSFTAWQLKPDGTYNWGTWVTQQYIAAGYLTYVDYGGSHPYTRDVPTMYSHMDEVKALYGNKPIIMSEYNLKGQPDYDTWRRNLDTLRPYLQQTTAVGCYYRLEQTAKEKGWPGVVTELNQPVEPFFSMYKSWPK